VNWLGSANRDIAVSAQAPTYIPTTPTQYGLVLRPTAGIQYRF